ncbi:MAG: shikimate dehydrogenase, partial [Lachnospiraceae bacterium]|nr:shikimate dehydrogenase [Lachnospiraceae bacterium]
MNIDGTTPIYGLIGNPTKHTLSPRLHNTLAEMTGIKMI